VVFGIYLFIFDNKLKRYKTKHNIIKFGQIHRKPASASAHLSIATIYKNVYQVTYGRSKQEDIFIYFHIISNGKYIVAHTEEDQ